MGKQSRIKDLQRHLRAELDKLNKDLPPDKREQLFQIARKKMLVEYIYKPAIKN